MMQNDEQTEVSSESAPGLFDGLRQRIQQLAGSVAATADEAADDAADGRLGVPVVVRVKLPPGEVARATLIIIGICLGILILYSIQDVIILLFLAILFATSIEPIVKRLRRGPFTRGTGALAVYVVILIIIGVPIALVAPNVVAQASSFTASLPDRIAALQEAASRMPPGLIRQSAIGGLQYASQQIQQPTAQGADVVKVGATAIVTVVNVLTVFVLAFYWIVEGPTFKRALLRVVPRHRAKDVNAVWVEVEDKIGNWVRGQLLLMLAIGVAGGIGFVVLGLPSPILLAVIAACAEIIPILGPVIAFAPAVVVALTIAPSKAVILIIYGFIVQEIESQVLVPRIMSHALGVSPLTVLIGIYAGASLYGIVGALVAVPIAASIQVVLAHVLNMEPPEQAKVHREQMKSPPAPVKEAEQRSA